MSILFRPDFPAGPSIAVFRRLILYQGLSTRNQVLFVRFLGCWRIFDCFDWNLVWIVPSHKHLLQEGHNIVCDFCPPGRTITRADCLEVYVLWPYWGHDKDLRICVIVEYVLPFRIQLLVIRTLPTHVQDPSHVPLPIRVLIHQSQMGVLQIDNGVIVVNIGCPECRDFPNVESQCASLRNNHDCCAPIKTFNCD